MPRYVEGRKTVTIRLMDEEYEQLKFLSEKTHQSMGSIAREYTIQGLCGTLTQSNVEFLAPIIREQVRNVLEPMMERMIALTAKTCIQAGTSAYLSADAILKFVPPTQRESVQESYHAARKKSLAYMKAKIEINE